MVTRKKPNREDVLEETSRSVSSHDAHLRKEIERVNAKMRHFMGVSATIIKEALKVFDEIWAACGDTRTSEDILEGKPEPSDELPTCGWDDMRRKLHLLRHYLDYVKKLCDGSISEEDEGRKRGKENAQEA